MRGAPLPTAAVTSRAHGMCASWVLLECLAGVVRRGHGCGVQGVCGCAPGSGFALQFGVGGAALCCGGSCEGVCSCGVPGLWLRWSVGHLGAAMSCGGAGSFVLVVVVVRWAVLSV
jgi:hypothetical protein